jgi:hypothetical protein
MLLLLLLRAHHRGGEAPVPYERQRHRTRLLNDGYEDVPDEEVIVVDAIDGNVHGLPCRFLLGTNNSAF